MFRNAVLIVLEGDVDYGIVIPILEGGEAYTLYLDCYPRRGGMLFMLRLLFQKGGRHIYGTIIIVLEGEEASS